MKQRQALKEYIPMRWGHIFNHYLKKGHDHSSAAYEADRWMERELRKCRRMVESEVGKEDPYRYFDGAKFKEDDHCKRCGCALNDEVADVDGEYCCHPCGDECSSS